MLIHGEKLIFASFCVFAEIQNIILTPNFLLDSQQLQPDSDSNSYITDVRNEGQRCLVTHKYKNKKSVLGSQ